MDIFSFIQKEKYYCALKNIFVKRGAYIYIPKCKRDTSCVHLGILRLLQLMRSDYDMRNKMNPTQGMKRTQCEYQNRAKQLSFLNWEIWGSRSGLWWAIITVNSEDVLKIKHYTLMLARTATTVSWTITAEYHLWMIYFAWELQLLLNTLDSPLHKDLCCIIGEDIIYNQGLWSFLQEQVFSNNFLCYLYMGSQVSPYNKVATPKQRTLSVFLSPQI